VAGPTSQEAIMTRFIPQFFAVTVKLPKNPRHNPRDKKTALCHVTYGTCTDATGEHHTLIVTGAGTVEAVMAWAREQYGHVTRVEVCAPISIDPRDEEITILHAVNQRLREELAELQFDDEG
jgi:hypothetical protein